MLTHTSEAFVWPKLSLFVFQNFFFIHCRLEKWNPSPSLLLALWSWLPSLWPTPRRLKKMTMLLMNWPSKKEMVCLYLDPFQHLMLHWKSFPRSAGMQCLLIFFPFSWDNPNCSSFFTVSSTRGKNSSRKVFCYIYNANMVKLNLLNVRIFLRQKT